MTEEPVMNESKKPNEPTKLDDFQIPYDGAQFNVLELSSRDEPEWSWERLHQSRQILDSLPMGIGLVVHGKLLFLNRRMAEILADTGESNLVGRDFLGFIPLGCQQLVAKSLRNALATSALTPVGETDFIRTNGKLITTHMIVRAIKFEEQDAVLALLSEISPLPAMPASTEVPWKEAADPLQENAHETTEAVRVLLERIDDLTQQCESLRRRGQLIGAIFDEAQDLVFSKDINLRYTFVNPAMQKLHGRSASEILGLSADDLMPGEAGKRVNAVDARVIAGETVEEVYTTPIHGIPLTFHGIRAPLRNPAGHIIGMFGIVRNITDNKGIRNPELSPAKRSYPSRVMKETLLQAQSVAASDGTVLLLGESGSGKDFMAKWIHDHSKRADGRFFSINCAAVSGELADSELFGHEAGAFTGARTAKKGLLQLAEGGTLLLNEIGEFSLPLQAKLLTFLDTKSFLRVGGEQIIHVNVRIMAATHRVLANEVAEGRFLAPLFYRLNVLKLDVPPLRERVEDIPIIAREIISSLAKEMQLKRVPEFDSSSLYALANYHWPGNVRELKNVVERALMLWKGGSLRIDTRSLDVIPEPWSHKVNLDADRSLHEVLDEVARALCVESVRRCNGSKTKAARMLGISRGVLYRSMKRTNMSRDFET
ncbi:sigma-54-dependent Fis family transcriptional regulator [Desulfomonile tiedjei]|nr:sigma-54-dependent Fis family transcriptional regulator [Desulfomonile tiedjei]